MSPTQQQLDLGLGLPDETQPARADEDRALAAWELAEAAWAACQTGEHETGVRHPDRLRIIQQAEACRRALRPAS